MFLHKTGIAAVLFVEALETSLGLQARSGAMVGVLLKSRPPRVDTEVVELQGSVESVRLDTGVAVVDGLPQG